MKTRPSERELRRHHGVIAARAKGGESSSADIYVYDEISNNPYWGISAKAFADQIALLEVDQLNVFINSPGGSVWDGIAIMNALRRHSATVSVSVDGIAASAASIIAMAGDHITMNRGAEMMVHEASTYAYGDATDLRTAADALEKISGSLADIYAARAGGEASDWRAIMRAETWYTAEEAVQAGLADEWVDAPATEARFDLSRFKNHPASQELPASEPGEPIKKKGDVMAGDKSKATVPDVLAGIRDRLGVTDVDATAEDLLAALNDALSAGSAVAHEGTVLIDKEVLASLEQNAADGAEALKQISEDRRERILQAALAAGKITAASKEKWAKQLAADESGTVSLLDSLAESSAVNVTEVGVGAISLLEITDAEEALYDTAWPDARKEA